MEPPKGEKRWRGLTASEVFALTFTNGTQGVMLTLPFTVAVFMVRSFTAEQGAAAAAPGGDAAGYEAHVGRLTGMLAAVYSLAQLTTSYAWGVASDAVGRKPVLIAGCCACASSLVWFGLAATYTGAAAARVLAGLCNGIIGAWKCMIGEALPPAAAGRVMALMSLSWGVGCIAGPSIGGLTSQPCTHWPAAPGCGEGGLLARRPYLLPCLIAAAFSAAAAVVNIVLLGETLPESKPSGGSSSRHGGSSSYDGDCDNLSHHDIHHHHCKEPVETTSETVMPPPRWWARIGLLQRLLLHAGYTPLQSDCTSDDAGTTRNRPKSSSIGGSGVANAAPLSKHDGCDVEAPVGGVDQGKRRGDVKIPAPAALQQSSLCLPRWDSEVLLPSAVAAAVARSSATLPRDKQQTQCSSGSAAGARLGALQLAALRPCDSVTEHQRGGRRSGAGGAGGAGGLAGGSSSDYCCGSDLLTTTTTTTTTSSSGIVDSKDTIVGRGNGNVSDEADAADAVDVTPLLLAPDDAGTVFLGCNKGITTTPSSSAPQPLHNKQRSWWRAPGVGRALSGYGCVCLLFCALDELTPIYAAAPLQQGGLGLSEADLAGPLAFGGAALVLVSLMAYPRAVAAWGTLPTARIGLVLAVATCAMTPAARLVAVEHQRQRTGSSSVDGSSRGLTTWSTWGLLYAAAVTKSAAGCAAFTGAMVAVNSLAPRDALGQVNGVGQSVAAAARGAGPAAAGLLWGAAAVAGPPAGALLPFAAVALAAVAAAVAFAGIALPGDEANDDSSNSGSSSNSNSGGGSGKGDPETAVPLQRGSSCCQGGC